MGTDLRFHGQEPTGRVYRDPALGRTYFRANNGDWVWENNCGHFSDGTVRPPWLDEEWRRRFDAGDPTYGDPSTYYLSPPETGR